MRSVRSASWLLALIGIGCTLANVGPGAEERQTQRAAFHAPYAEVYRAVLQQAGQMKWGLLFADREAGAIRVATPWSLSAWEDTLAINLTQADSAVLVVVRSTLAQSPNRKNVARFLDGVSHRLAPH